MQVLKVQLGAGSSWEEAELKLNSFAAVSHKLLEQVSALLVIALSSSSALLVLAVIIRLESIHASCNCLRSRLRLCAHAAIQPPLRCECRCSSALSQSFDATTLSQNRTILVDSLDKWLTLFHTLLHDALQFQITGKLPQHKLLLDDSTATTNNTAAIGGADVSDDDDDVEPLHESNCHNSHSSSNAAAAQSPPLCRRQRQRARSAVAAAATVSSSITGSTPTSSGTKPRTAIGRGSSSCSGRVTPASSPIKTRSSIAQALAHRKSTAAAAAAAAAAAMCTAGATVVNPKGCVLSSAHEAAATTDSCSSLSGVAALSNVLNSTSSNTLNSGSIECDAPSPVVAVRKAFLGA
jgi:hypothetical protein